MKLKIRIIIAVVVVMVIAAAFLLALLYSVSTRAPANATAQSGEIDMSAVCQGALAYMTFPSGAEADAFVQECKDGKHPEVIAKWKVDNGIADDRAI